MSPSFGKASDFAANVLTAGPEEMVGDFWALFVTDGELRCEFYSGGVPIEGEPRGSIAYSLGEVVDGPVGLIETDSESLVADGSFVFKVGASIPASKLVVWDVVGAAVHSRDVTAGSIATTPIYSGGFLYWLEWDPDFANPTTVSLWRSRCDFSSASLIETFDLPEQNGNAGGARIALLIPTSNTLVFSWRTGNEDGHDQMAFYAKTLAAGSPSDVSEDWAAAFGIRENVDNPPWLDGSVGGAALWDDVEGFAYLGVNRGTNHEDGFNGGNAGVLQRLLNAGQTPSVVWPNNSGAWSVSPVSVSVSGDFAALYGGGHLLRHDRSLPIEAGDPAVSVDVDFHPTLDVVPAAMFYRGLP